MKAIPRDDLINILENMFREGSETEIVLQDDIDNLFEKFGDDYFKDYGYGEPWQLTEENQRRKELLKKYA